MTLPKLSKSPQAQGLKPRPYTIEEYTRTVCPRCAEGGLNSSNPDTFIDGMLVSHDGSIWMRRFCPKHGETESLYEENAEIWRERFGWSTPTLAITPDRQDNTQGFPLGYLEGLPASHGQHTCILLLNVTERCNYSCPTCYASALAPGAPAPEYETPSLEELEHTVDTMIERENGKLSVIMVSGGEPTVRKDIQELLSRLVSKSVTRVMLNTNGRRILKDKDFLTFLKQNRDRIEVYLQFDGLTDGIYQNLRAEALAEEKRHTLQALSDAGVSTTLVVTACKGVNDTQLGEIFKLGLDTPYCSGLAIQPMFGSGRTLTYDPMDRLTPTGVISRLGQQTDGILGPSDFIPLPCSHKDCCDITYLIRTDKQGWTSLPKLVGRDELKKWIHLAANTISFENISEDLKTLASSGVLQRVFSEQQKTSAIQLASDIFRMCDCIPGVADLLGAAFAKGQTKKCMQQLAERTFRVTIKMFMDAHTFHEARLRQCCVHVGTYEEDPRRYSFCWRWLFENTSDFPLRDLERLPMAGGQG